MKTTLALVGAAVLGVLYSFGPKTNTFVADPTKSKVEWYAEKVTGKHNGIIQISSGNLIVKNDAVIGGKFEFNMNTIQSTDMGDSEYGKKLDGHLKSADFFNVEKFPTSSFEIKSVKPITNKNEKLYTHNVSGILTIKGIAQEVSFDAIIKNTNDIYTCVGSVVVDRTKFDIRYGSKSFFSDIGDKAIYDEFTVRFNVISAASKK